MAKAYRSSSSDLPSFRVIIPAAGTGHRFQSDTPKQYHMIHGKTVLRHTVEAFYTVPECKAIYVTYSSNDADKCHDALKGLENIHFVQGGSTRKESVHNALLGLAGIKGEEIILIHDAARPCIKRYDVESLLRALQERRAASLATPMASTLRKANAQNEAQESIPRDDLWAIQTPQAFRYCDLMRAHKEADPKQSYTDDTQLVSALGIPIGLVTGTSDNIKITRKEDLRMAEKLLAPSSNTHQTCTGLGFDVHAFDTQKNSSVVRLCGIDLPHTHGLKGHSDADVGLHALCDALYGALGAGDIGRHFPPSDDTFKDMDSARFLEHAVALLTERGGRLINADITLICEEPKITPHAPEMQARIAHICGVRPEQINIKATTTEQLGFTGRKEGIAAQAIVSILLPQEEI